MSVTVLRCGPQVTVQDFGRSGLMATGLSVGGAADTLALCEAAALLGREGAALEMAGTGGTFRIDADTRIALTGAPMRATLDGTPLVWNAAHPVQAGQVLTIGAGAGYGYLSFGGGLLTPQVLGSRSGHLVAGIGAVLVAGDMLPIGKDRPNAARVLDVADRTGGGIIRMMNGPQTSEFTPETLDAFQRTTFSRSPKANRQGVRLDHDGDGFAAPSQLSRLSDFITVGDVQMTGDGTPYVLLSECQTIGGYPRIGTVLPADLPLVAQAAVGAKMTFRMVSLREAEAAWQPRSAIIAALAAKVRPLVRDPAQMSDLLSYTLVSGFITGDEEWL